MDARKGGISHILAIGQGTTSSRAIAFNGQMRVTAAAQKEFAQHFPDPSWMEHDADDLWAIDRGHLPDGDCAGGSGACGYCRDWHHQPAQNHHCAEPQNGRSNLQHRCVSGPAHRRLLPCTMLYDLCKGRWSGTICGLFDIPMDLLPEMRDCAADYYMTRGFF
jgi:hypothetical protein